MEPKQIKLTTLTTTTALFFLLFYGVDGWATRQFIDSYAVLGLTRLVFIAAITTLLIQTEGGLTAVGWGPGTWSDGLRRGALWSLGFALAAGIGMALLIGAGKNPIAMMRFPLPADPVELMLFFIVGGLIAPIAEELCFRGILYTYFRRWGVIIALIASTAIFVALHAVKGIPLTQMVGGIVFAIAYETSGNLTVPITIHTLGNLAIFTLSML